MWDWCKWRYTITGLTYWTGPVDSFPYTGSVPPLLLFLAIVWAYFRNSREKNWRTDPETEKAKRCKTISVLCWFSKIDSNLRAICFAYGFTRLTAQASFSSIDHLHAWEFLQCWVQLECADAAITSSPIRSAVPAPDIYKRPLESLPTFPSRKAFIDNENCVSRLSSCAW